MLITVDIGNSNINISAYNLDGLSRENIDEKIKDICPLGNFQISAVDTKSADEYSLIVYNILKINQISISKIKAVAISSVVPSLTSVIYQAFKKISKAYIYTVGSGMKTGLNITIDTSTQLGTDLVSNAVASISMYSYPMAIFDFGTANTITLIDKDKNLSGVIIMPGVMLSLKSLAQNTALLNQISLEKNKNNPIIIGKNTEDSIISGIIGSTTFSVDGFIDKIKQLWEISDLTVVSTGDWSSYIIPHCNHEIIDNKNLTSLGLLKLYIMNERKLKY